MVRRFTDTGIYRKFYRMKDAIILFIYPSRSRPQKFAEGLKSIKDNLARPELAEFVFTIDSDDPQVDEYIKICNDNKVIFYGGESKGKIHAVNRGMKNAPDKWDIVFVMSDDMFVVKQGFDDIIRNDFQEHFPDGDGLLHYNDGYQKENCCTLSILGRKYYERDGFIYNPNYTGLWCDVEATEAAHIRGKHNYMGDEKIICKHVHPATKVLHPLTNTQAEWDNQYRRDENMKIWGEDSIVLKAHRENWYGIPEGERVNGFKYDKDEELKVREENYRVEFGYSFQYPALKLQILIPTTPDRKEMFESLIVELQRQFIENGITTGDCILVDESPKLQDDAIRGKSIGTKRNDLVSNATADYIAFKDSDDWPEPNYIFDQLEGIKKGVDACSLKGIMTTDGKNPEIFEHSIKYSEWKTNETGEVKYERFPNHLNCIKREHAIQFKFPEINHGEDRDWSEQLFASGLIKTEHYIERPIYNYRFISNK